MRIYTLILFSLLLIGCGDTYYVTPPNTTHHLSKTYNIIPGEIYQQGNIYKDCTNGYPYRYLGPTLSCDGDGECIQDEF
ncbi:MAG: hypothetical protein GXO40_04180 [Epsilonproteobacteria bacterium]|nr:hypothetical protein [Campylobacterota bacterium]